MAATDIYLCLSSHGPTDIDLRTVTACGAVATTPAGGTRRPRRRVVRYRSEVGVLVGVTGSGAIHDALPMVALTSGRSVTRHTSTHLAELAAGTGRLHAIRHTDITPEATGTASAHRSKVNVAALTRYRPVGAGQFRLPDPDELLLLDLL